MSTPYVAAALGLAEFAPSLARLLGGEKAEKIATQVVDVAKKITGQNDVNSMVTLMREHPHLIIEFQKELIRLEADMELADLRDRQDARYRDISFLREGRYNIRADIMVLCAAGGLIACLVSLAYYADFLPGEAVGIISTIAGIFGACLKDAYAFEFGSSRSSKLKDSTMAAIIERNNY